MLQYTVNTVVPVSTEVLPPSTIVLAAVVPGWWYSNTNSTAVPSQYICT